ncbi:hypothetical protein MTP99_008962 [Tenebrio molitor]|uniref:uncharacterized protein isoform X1 n=1 Tax=Tenebrio molitor TaxID=7067 RepID=UPI001C3BC9A8|nr:hypothetical protein MTP99_008962 [Tenebrio molitor]CAH1367692.1 unnamed protein product [Tenebrio molitor]
MATVSTGPHKHNSLDLVAKNDILKALVVLEDKARRDWHRKWGFLLNFDQMILEEAAKSNVSEEEYRRRTVERKNNTKGLDFVCDVKMAESVPQTSSAVIGWRSRPEDRLERTGDFYISPLQTLPPKEHATCIFLG